MSSSTGREPPASAATSRSAPRAPISESGWRTVVSPRDRGEVDVVEADHGERAGDAGTRRRTPLRARRSPGGRRRRRSPSAAREREQPGRQLPALVAPVRARRMRRSSTAMPAAAAPRGTLEPEIAGGEAERGCVPRRRRTRCALPGREQVLGGQPAPRDVVDHDVLNAGCATSTSTTGSGVAAQRARRRRRRAGRRSRAARRRDRGGRG